MADAEAPVDCAFLHVTQDEGHRLIPELMKHGNGAKRLKQVLIVSGEPARMPRISRA